MAWKYEFAPGGIDFVSDRELGKDYKGDLFVGSASGRGGNIFHLPIDNNRKEVDPDDRRLRDGVADNLAQVRHHRERDAALRRRTSASRRTSRRAPTGTLYRRLVLTGHGLRDPQEVTRSRRTSRRSVVPSPAPAYGAGDEHPRADPGTRRPDRGAARRLLPRLAVGGRRRVRRDRGRAAVADRASTPSSRPTRIRSSRSARRRCCTRRSGTRGRCCRWRRRPGPSRSRRSSTASPASRWS